MPTDLEAGHIENKYDKAYEEKMNPFIDWKQKEKASRKKQLSMADRVMYEFGQIISSSRSVCCNFGSEISVCHKLSLDVVVPTLQASNSLTKSCTM